MATEFGRDTSCTDTLRTGRYATGLRLVAEAAYRRLTTPRGMLRGGEDERNYGLDLMSIVGRGNPTLVAAELPGRIRAELLKDERIDAVEVDVAVVTSGPATSFTVSIDVTTAEGPFALQLSVSDVSVTLLRIST